MKLDLNRNIAVFSVPVWTDSKKKIPCFKEHSVKQNFKAVSSEVDDCLDINHAAFSYIDQPTQHTHTVIADHLRFKAVAKIRVKIERYSSNNGPEMDNYRSLVKDMQSGQDHLRISKVFEVKIYFHRDVNRDDFLYSRIHQKGNLDAVPLNITSNVASHQYTRYRENSPYILCEETTVTLDINKTRLLQETDLFDLRLSTGTTDDDDMKQDKGKDKVLELSCALVFKLGLKFLDLLQPKTLVFDVATGKIARSFLDYAHNATQRDHIINVLLVLHIKRIPITTELLTLWSDLDVLTQALSDTKKEQVHHLWLGIKYVQGLCGIVKLNDSITTKYKFI